MYPEKANDMKKMVLEYIQVLRNAHSNNSPPMMSEDRSNGLKRGTIELDESGFPKAPQPRSWSKVTKTDLEPLYRMYITRQYRRFYINSSAEEQELMEVVCFRTSLQG